MSSPRPSTDICGPGLYPPQPPCPPIHHHAGQPDIDTATAFTGTSNLIGPIMAIVILVIFAAMAFTLRRLIRG